VTSSYTRPAGDTTRPTLTGSFAMAASTHFLATGAAQSVLERGGNAFDAAVAAGFVLHVVEPHLNGPGGDMVALVAPAATGRVEVLVGQGPAPERATIEHFRGAGFDFVPGAGALAAAVPGSVEAWLWLLERHGTWDIAEVLDYALHYAEHGHPAAPQLCEVIATMSGHFRTHWPTSAAQWCPDGVVPRPGETITMPAYAATLRALLRAAGPGSRTERIAGFRREWKTGLVATEAARFAAVPHRHSGGRDHAGVITADDFARFTVRTEAPLTLDFRGHTIAKAGFWSQGPVLLQALAILDTFADDRLDPSSALGGHTVIETLKLALSDRDSHYGDARPERHAALRALLSPRYAAERARSIGETASTGFRPGTIDGGTAYRPPLIEDFDEELLGGAGEPTVRLDGETRGDTCHLDVVDRWGNFVSATPSGGWLQSSPAIPALGFSLGTRLQMTWLDPAGPSALMPGRRPRTTLSPTMLLKNGAPVAALGTPGGDQQDQWQLLYLLRTIVGGYQPQQAIDAPALHTTANVGSFYPRTWTPAGVVAETRLGADVLDDLRARGHRVTTSGAWTLGRLSTVTRDPATGELGAAANSRGNTGYAAGR
jgi:gamma-glutamyltranspeptidase / glutathione hydrolase